MSNAKHTPGPWTYERKRPGGGDYHDKTAYIFAHGDVIGLAYQCGDALNAQANAALMAAAPELAEALSNLADAIIESGNGSVVSLTEARAALARAGL